MTGFAQQFFPLIIQAGIHFHSAIQVSNPASGKSEWISPTEIMKIIIDPLPVEKQDYRL